MAINQQTGGKFKPTLLFNREISWMAFNERVLDEALDASYPLLERLKFISIVSSNLDEFFMIRVAGLERKFRSNPHDRQVEGTKTADALYQIRELTLQQKQKQAEALADILKQLQKQGLYLQADRGSLDPETMEYAFSKMPVPAIQFVSGADGFRILTAGVIYVFVRLQSRIAVMAMPEGQDRLIELPQNIAKAQFHYLLAEKVLAANAARYFPGETVLETFAFKIVRDADLKIEPDVEPEALLASIEKALQKRGRLPAVRLEVDAPAISDGALMLAEGLRLSQRSIYRYDLPLDLKILWRLYDHPHFEKLRFPDMGKTEADTPLPINKVPDLVRVLHGDDVLLHHPYDSFETVVKLIDAAAEDKAVVAIRQTLYRTGKNSSIVRALINAAKAGKSVTVLVELRARFDEATNIGLVKEFKKNGVKVLKGISNKKIHCKMTQIIRREGEDVTSVVHVGTGNYNPATARIYTDLSLLTTSTSFGRDVEKLFKSFESGRLPRLFEVFVPAPEQLHKKLTQWVRGEARRAIEGDKDARIVAKMNSLVDPKMCEELYAASRAGVKIDLIVRGACVLRPGVAGVSENIRVISIVDKYLEHSRIYYFKNGDQPLVYLSSADWMPRSFHRRVEVAFPVEEIELKNYVRDFVLETYLKDNVKARELMPDGRWVRKKPKEGEAVFHAQEYFEKLAKSRYKGTPLSGRFIKYSGDKS